MTVAGLLLIAVPIAFNVAFARLAATFDYPDVLRQDDVLDKFRAGGNALILTWWAFALTAVAMVPLVALLSHAIADADAGVLAVATPVGILAAAVQFLGLVRWPFLVPYLADSDDPAAELVFQAFNRYLGVAVGEHLGYLFTGAWTTLIGVALTQTAAAPAVLGVIGIVIGPVLMLCALEFVGRGLPLAGRIVPVAYVAWSLWLVAVGIALLLA
jgi:hypothetical protein